MKNVLHEKIWPTGAVQIHVYPPLITLIKSRNNTKGGKYCAENKLCIDPTSKNSDLYELKMALFDKGKTEDLLLFVRNFKMMLNTSGTLTSNAKIRFIRTLIYVEELS